MPKSQLQFKVLNSYKQLLKASANRPSVQARVKNEFRQNKSIKRMELQLIEHKLRIADNRLQALQEDSITKSSTFKIGGTKKD